MTVPERSYLFIDDIIEAMGSIVEYLNGLTYEEFSNDRMRIDAVLRNVQIIGEAAKNTPDEIKERYPNVPWRRMVGLRNIVVHSYFGIDLETIWTIGKENIPDTMDLMVQIQKEINKH